MRRDEKGNRKTEERVTKADRRGNQRGVDGRHKSLDELRVKISSGKSEVWEEGVVGRESIHPKTLFSLS